MDDQQIVDLYWKRDENAIAETDRPFLSQGVKNYNLEQEQQMLVWLPEPAWDHA